MKRPTAIMVVGNVAITGEPGAVVREAMRQEAMQEIRRDLVRDLVEAGVLELPRDRAKQDLEALSRWADEGGRSGSN